MTLHVREIVAEARSGSRVRDAIREAVLLAVTEWRTVRMVFGDRSYLVSPEALMGSVARPILDSQGETPNP